MKGIIGMGVLVVAFASCNSAPVIEDNRNKEIKSNIAAGGQSEEELQKRLEEVRKEQEAAEKERLAKLTTMSFDKLSHDFGNVEPLKENTTTFVVTNTGNKPLIIEDVSASCGCTTPEKPTEPILPGKSDNITVTFKSKPGQKNEQNKTVTVTANTDPAVQKLNIRAFVKE